VESAGRDFESRGPRARGRRNIGPARDVAPEAKPVPAFVKSARLFNPLRADVSQIRHRGVIGRSRGRELTEKIICRQSGA
jgi:hypothetical protein